MPRPDVANGEERDGADAASEERDPRDPGESFAQDPLAALQPGTIIEGKYRIDRALGRGGMGIVVVATHLDLNEQVALKFLQVRDEEVEGDFRARFALEARVCAKLRNDHIARVHDVGVWNEKIPFMVMDYLDGVDLRRRMKDKGRIGVAQAVDYVVQICEGLAEAHAKGIVHRDLKPPNIFITKRKDGSELVKVLDFGISKWASIGDELGELTKTGMMLGSPKYMSPEQLGCETVDARSDVWSIGAMLYAMLTGKPPYDYPQVTQTFMAIASGARPVAPSLLEPAIPPALDALILRCLTRDRSQRVQNVAELAGEALEAIDSPFASQARDVIGAVLDPENASSSRPRLSLLSPTTGSHAAFTLAREESSQVQASLPSDPSRPALRHRLLTPRAKAAWASCGAVAGLALLVLARGAGAPTTVGPASGTGAVSARVRVSIAKALERERATSLSRAPQVRAPQAVVWTRSAARTPEPPPHLDTPTPAPASTPTAPAPRPAPASKSNALDDRQ